MTTTAVVANLLRGHLFLGAVMGMDLLNFDELHEHLALGDGPNHVVGATRQKKCLSVARP